MLLMKYYSSVALLLLVAGILGVLWPFSSRAAETPKAGDKAPPIEGTDQDGKTWKLADAIGKKIVLLYF
jgi:hypothetical protein